MPQQDRHKERVIPIEFNFYDILDNLPAKERCSIVDYLRISYNQNKQAYPQIKFSLRNMPVLL